MAKHRISKVSNRRRRTAPRGVSHRSVPRPKSILILQCDADKLESQGFRFSSSIEQTVRLFAPTSQSCRVKVTSQQSLLKGLADISQTIPTVDILVVEAHSNNSGLAMGSGFHLTWAQFANWIAKFQPKHVVLIGCQAGRWLPCSALFRGIPSLKEIYGSPTLLSESEAKWVFPLVLYLIHGGKLNKKQAVAASIANFLVSKSVTLRRTRAEFNKAGVEEGKIWTLGESWLRRFLNR